MENKMFKNDAKSIVDQLFDLKFFQSNITRDDMNGFENLIEYMLKSRHDSYIRLHELLKMRDERRKNPKEEV